MRVADLQGRSTLSSILILEVCMSINRGRVAPELYPAFVDLVQTAVQTETAAFKVQAR